MKTWYAVQKTREDAWDYGSHDKDEAIKMLREQGCGLIAVIDEAENFCEDEILFEDLEEAENAPIGVITVDDFVKAVKTFGFESPVVTAIWNTMEKNPNNQEEFETVYAMWAAGKFKS